MLTCKYTAGFLSPFAGRLYIYLSASVSRYPGGATKPNFHDPYAGFKRINVVVKGRRDARRRDAMRDALPPLHGISQFRWCAPRRLEFPDILVERGGSAQIFSSRPVYLAISAVRHRGWLAGWLRASLVYVCTPRTPTHADPTNPLFSPEIMRESVCLPRVVFVCARLSPVAGQIGRGTAARNVT